MGGAPGAGGTVGSGGITAAGGTTATGGTVAAGGTPTSGGTPGAGGTGGASGGTAGTGGVATTGGAGGTAGATTAGSTSTGGISEPTGEVTCTDPVYGTVTIAAGAMIDDFADGDTYQIVQAGRGVDAEPWHAYAYGDTNDEFGEMSVPSEYNPRHANNNFEVDTSESGPCALGGALHASSPGGGGSDFWGVGFGIDFLARTADRKKQVYDASGYTGVGFWARCTADVQFVYLKIVDGPEDADIAAPQCDYGAPEATTTCNQYGVKNAVLTNQWTYYKLFFGEGLQDPNSARFGNGMDPSQMTAFQVHVNIHTNRDGTPLANPFDCWIDDVHFLTDPAPQIPNESVTYTTSGNTISRNGSPHTIRGLVRPSMEWDLSGFGVTREDIQRMAAWGPNAIRLAVMDTYWTGDKGDVYQQNVRRVVSWILQEGMDAILDLHYVAGAPNAQHRTFWSSISSDPFFQDGRIIFELYNEPTDGFDNLRNWMQSTTDVIRGNGANNLILIGGVDYSYDISGYVANPVSGGAIAYVTHPYSFKGDPGDQVAFLTPAQSLPVIATEFGNANVEGFNYVAPDDCNGSIYSNYVNAFEGAGMSWTAWAWIVDEWGCGFPQMIADYSGTPNAIGQPVYDALQSL
jgi:hypothetical protein